MPQGLNSALGSTLHKFKADVIKGNASLYHYKMLIVFALLFQTFISFVETSSCQKLGSYGGNPSQVSISGFSSGADFANQYHVAFSSELKGVGSVAGVVFYCAEGTFARDNTCKSNPETINISHLVKLAKHFSEAGLIDDIAHINGSKVFIFQGTKDSVVNPGNGPKIETFYKEFGADVQKDFGHIAEHSMPTDNFGNICTEHRTPYITQCDYNGAFMILNHIYGNLTQPRKKLNSTAQVITFDQREFIKGHPAAISMDKFGYAYIPKYCKRNTGCKVHVALHGCLQSRSSLEKTFALHAGYNEVAKSNNIIILYPQAAISVNNPENPNGCLDWWGYTGSNYATKAGVQMAAIHQMIKRVLAN